MTALDLESTPTTMIDARGSFCPGPLMELIRGIREGQVGDTLTVISSDNGSKSDIPAWVNKAGHRLIGVFPHEGYDEIVVEKLK
jgi:tRNA 2-thiouridine synthesizing protein A